VPAIGTAVTGVRMTDNGSGYAKVLRYAFTAPTAQANMAGFDCKAQAWNGTIHCAVGLLNTVPTTTCFTSTDGLLWTARTGMPLGTWKHITWDGVVFCAAGYRASPADGVITSATDGIT